MIKMILRKIKTWFYNQITTGYTEKLAFHKWHGKEFKLWWDNKNDHLFLSRPEIVNGIYYIVLYEFHYSEAIGKLNVWYEMRATEKCYTFWFFEHYKLLGTVNNLDPNNLDLETFITNLNEKEIKYLNCLKVKKTRVPFKGLKYSSFYFNNTELNKTYSRFSGFYTNFQIRCKVNDWTSY